MVAELSLSQADYYSWTGQKNGGSGNIFPATKIAYSIEHLAELFASAQATNEPIRKMIYSKDLLQSQRTEDERGQAI